ncbi:hypothetical protein GQ43DRAFT_365158 [Delitschia confertaspora ATCC 74209]|uniref:Uncharacterized protein n=1 Tax=Delitschia confertaspora ATCC 74209 TaxID=1513339 RepID=A0A9P4JS53_9PLEO|nr:hypothetical protein GQ43DRAFT_365158 [Delitschia confertaspora ATCC 74209]
MEAFNAPERHIVKSQSSPADVYSTDASSPVKTEIHSSKRSHLHGLHSQKRHHRHTHSRRGKDSGTPSSFSDLLKQASRSAHPSPAQSRPDSSRSSAVKPTGYGELEVRSSRAVQPEDVVQERMNMKVREDELRSSLQSLSEHSLQTSRRLDDTYYSILEKVALLRQTIGNLQELSGLTKELYQTFQGDSKEFAEEMRGQIDAFNAFTIQEKQVWDLQGRIKAGRDKADALKARLAEARKRVDARAEVEARWEVKTRRRLRIIWGILGSILGIVVIILCVQQVKSVQSAKDPEASLAAVARSKLAETSIPEPAKEILFRQSPIRPRPHTVSTPLLSKSSMTENTGLHVFDEL